MRTFVRSFWFVGLMLVGATISTHALAAAKPAVDEDQPPISDRLSNNIDPAVLDHVTAKQAFEWWARTTSIPLVLNWDKMEKDGIDPGTVVTLDLRNVPARQLLTLIMQQVSSDQPLIYETTQWYVSVMTKTEANRHMVMRFYDVGDLIHDPTPVGEPPRLDLSAALSGSNTGSSSGGGTNSGTSSGSGGGIFATTSTGQSEKMRSDTERTEDLAKVIRDSIEPDIWTENGGKASIRFYKGRLIVNAPPYVQAQIGIPEPIHDAPAVNPQYVVVSRPAANPSSVAGVATQKPSPVAGIAAK